MFATLVALALGSPAALSDDKEKEKPLPEAAQKELKKLEGKWKATKAVTNGNEEVPSMDGNDVIIEFKGRKLLMNDKEVMDVAALDPSTDPKIIDIKALQAMGVTTKGQVYEAIYKLDGDALVMAVYVGEGKKRPEKFESPEGSGTVVVTLKRVKD